MKKITLISWTFMLFFINACEFHQSVNKDLMTGASSSGNGINSENIDILINDNIANKNTFAVNDQVQILFRNLEGLKKVNGKIYPGLKMLITTNEKDTIANYPDLLSDLQNGTNLHPLLLKANFQTSNVFEPEKKYKLYIKIWDKKGAGYFTYELPFTVK